MVLAFHIIHKRFIHYTVAARGGIITREIPVAQVIGAGLMQGFNGLEDHINGNGKIGWRDELRDLFSDLFIGE